METLLIWLVVMAVLLTPVLTLLGVFVGAWLMYRSLRGESPVPSPAGVARSVIEVIKPSKKESKAETFKMPQMRS